jgi:hypothetical protein
MQQNTPKDNSNDSGWVFVGSVLAFFAAID